MWIVFLVLRQEATFGNSIYAPIGCILLPPLQLVVVSIVRFKSMATGITSLRDTTKTLLNGWDFFQIIFWREWSMTRWHLAFWVPVQRKVMLSCWQCWQLECYHLSIWPLFQFSSLHPWPHNNLECPLPWPHLALSYVLIPTSIGFNAWFVLQWCEMSSHFFFQERCCCWRGQLVSGGIWFGGIAATFYWRYWCMTLSMV